MKKFLSILGLVFAIATPAMAVTPIGTLGAVETYEASTRGGKRIVRQDIIELYAQVNSNNRYAGFRKSLGTAAYTPSGSNAFYVIAVRYLNDNGGGQGTARLFETSTVLAFDDATSPTETVQEYGTGSFFPYTAPTWATPFDNDRMYTSQFKVTNTKYLGTQITVGSGRIWVYGYEAP